MLFSIIYSFDCSSQDDIKKYMPPQHTKYWKITERGKSEYTDLRGKLGKHRKLCAILEQKQFDEFVEKLQLTASDIETGGSIGAPGFGYGWAPAICFEGYIHSEEGVYLNAYVTPVPRTFDRDEIKHANTERSWQRLRRAVISQYRKRSVT